MKDGGCALCSESAFRLQGHQWLCKKHYRFRQMRANAKRRSKAVPSYELLEKLLEINGLRCEACERDMVWLASEDQSRVLSLQHDRSGDMRFLCRRCNTRHGKLPGDIFYTLPDSHRYCHDCKTVKPIDDFSRDRSKLNGRKSYCKPCAHSRQKEWRASL